jgi:hypothetical protein
MGNLLLEEFLWLTWPAAALFACVMVFVLAALEVEYCDEHSLSR